MTTAFPSSAAASGGRDSGGGRGTQDGLGTQGGLNAQGAPGGPGGVAVRVANTSVGSVGRDAGPVIEVDGVGKTFVVRRRAGRMRRERVDVAAVSDLTFRVDAGEMVGYLGPNGAGKSTTIKMLIGILVPSAGRIRVCGLDPSRQRTELARRLGVVFGQRTTLWWDLPLRDSFDLLRRIYRIPAGRYQENLDHFVELLQLASFLDTPVRQLSLGQR